MASSKSPTSRHSETSKKIRGDRSVFEPIHADYNALGNSAPLRQWRGDPHDKKKKAGHGKEPYGLGPGTAWGYKNKVLFGGSASSIPRAKCSSIPLSLFIFFS